MDRSELNVERKRKRKIVEQGATDATLDSVNDPLISDLIAKERKFMKMLTSNVAPIHNSISEALDTGWSAFDEFEYYESNQLGPDDQMNFSYWRAKILSTLIEWAKTFQEFQVI